MTLQPLEVPISQPRVGLLLVATPVLSETEFDRTVLLILEHDESGTFAVVLNRPSDITVDSVLPEWSNDPVGGDILYMGCLLYTSPSPRDGLLSRMPSSA